MQVLAAMKDHINAIMVNIAVTRSINPNMVDATEKSSAVLVFPINRAGPSILSAVVVAGEAES